MDLVSHDDGGGFERCVRCGGVAAGPCARCRQPVCGDCVVLTESSASVWAICKVCAKKGGRSLRPGWVAALFWLILPLVGLFLLIQLLERIFR